MQTSVFPKRTERNTQAGNYSCKALNKKRNHNHCSAHFTISRNKRHARKEIPNFVEVWIKASLEECKRRDPKGLYKKALAGEMTNLTGLQAPYEEPKNPELILDTEKHTPQESLEMILSKLKELGYLK